LLCLPQAVQDQRINTTRRADHTVRRSQQKGTRSVQDPLVQMRGISKRFGGVTALNNVNLDAYAGEVLAIVGDNGAGKSTLIKVLTGVYQPTEGEIFLGGEKMDFSSHADAIEEGIDAVYQTLALADHLDPAANMFLGNELTKRFLGITLLDNKTMRQETERVLMERLGVRLKSLDAATESLSGGQRQAVAIARAVYHQDLRVLVMDEPTAALGPQETARTLSLIKTLREQGLAIILISHSLDNVFEVSDCIHVQRRGRSVGTVRTADSNTQDVLGMIVGAEEAA
jgi:ABC-type sugar transport system ATPase subunit